MAWPWPWHLPKCATPESPNCNHSRNPTPNQNGDKFTTEEIDKLICGQSMTQYKLCASLGIKSHSLSKWFGPAPGNAQPGAATAAAAIANWAVTQAPIILHVTVTWTLAPPWTVALTLLLAGCSTGTTG